MDCGICKDPIKDGGRTRVAHLVIDKTVDEHGQGHVFTHGDIDRPEHTKEMLELAAEECKVAIGQHDLLEGVKEVVFHNRQRIGDMLVFTAGIRDFKAAYPHIKVGVCPTAAHIFDYNKNADFIVTPDKFEAAMGDPKAIQKRVDDRLYVRVGPGKLTNMSNRIDWHFTNGFRVSIEEALGIKIPQGESRPDVWFTQEEYDAPRVIEGPYWIICIAGERGWGCKMYPFVKWQKFVSDNPGITFVQVGTKGDNHPRLQGPNVIDYIGKTEDRKTGIRDLFKLFLNAEGSIGLVSFHMHLSGALYKPAIVVAGAREPVHFTRYPGHAYLATDGMLPCAVKACWHCDIKSCTNPVHRKNQSGLDEIVPKCVDIIEPEDLTRALRNYYAGGRLIKGVPCEKPKLKNIVPTPPKKLEESPLPEQHFDMYGLKWGGSAILEDDWTFMRQVIQKYNVKTVLEFGAGLSSLLFHQAGVKLTSYETLDIYAHAVRGIIPGINIQMWDGKDIYPEPYPADLVFVDGPSGPENRGDAIRLAAKLGKMVIVHDGWCVSEKAFMAKYLDSIFKEHVKGGRRCHFYSSRQDGQKTAVNTPIIDLPQEMDEDSYKASFVENDRAKPMDPGISKAVGQKFIKIISTARGWGGCARSITTIMRLLIKAGHKVEFIPFRNAVTSSEMKAMLSNELKHVQVTENYETIKESCDVLFMYADDYIWEFEKPDIVSAFSNIGADRKVMMLNYRRGKVGQIPWTTRWNKYMFLNSWQQKDFLDVTKRCDEDEFSGTLQTKVLPPCTDLTPFFEAIPNYESGIRIVRHSSQNDTKFPKDFNDEVVAVLRSRPDVDIAMLPGPSFIPDGVRYRRHRKSADPREIARFLSQGNLFWYSLPQGYMDMGPRVILEAMAAGLPVIADNWGGAIDRVTPETGWLCDAKNQHVEIIEHLTVSELKKKGEAARERAYQEFVPERWIDAILQ